MFKRTLAIGLAATGFLLLAKDDPRDGGVPVKMIVTVEPRHGEDAPPVPREDVLIHQGKEVMKAADWIPLRGDQAGMELAILLDDGSAFTLGSHLEELAKFMKGQPSTTSIAVGYMRNGTYVEVQAFTNDHERAAAALRLPLGSSGAGGSPYLSLSDLIKRWKPGALRREVLLVTSGVDPLGGTNLQNPYMDAAIADAQRAGIPVHSMYTRSAGHAFHSFWLINIGQSLLAKLAEETGGESYYMGLGEPVSFEPYLNDMASHLQRQYLLTFHAKPEKKGSWVYVKVSAETPNADLVSPIRAWVPGK